MYIWIIKLAIFHWNLLIHYVFLGQKSYWGNFILLLGIYNIKANITKGIILCFSILIITVYTI